MYLTPILYPITLLEDKRFIYNIVKLNPMYYYVEYIRDVMMYNTVPDIIFNLKCIGIAIVSLIIGSLVFKKCEGKFILHI